MCDFLELRSLPLQDVVKIGVQAHDSYISYTRIVPSQLSPVTIQFSADSTTSAGDFDTLVSYPVVNGSIDIGNRLTSEPFDTRSAYAHTCTHGDACRREH